MKKSEMIEKLLNYFYNSEIGVQELCGCCYRDVSGQECEEIIDFLQQEGMLPPEDKDKSFKMLDNGEMIYNVNEWENE